jgi:site-specific recombinase XerD
MRLACILILVESNNRLDCAQSVFLKIQDAYAPSTMRAYRADWSEFASYCAKFNEATLPARPIVLASFIEHVTSQGNSSASIRRKLVSIAAVHRWADCADPTKASVAKLATRKMHRKLGRMCKQAEPVNKTLYLKMLDRTCNDLRGKRDRVLLMLAYETMRRRSELNSLLVKDIHVTPNGAAILLRRSKTDQERNGCWLHISPRTLNTVQESL